MPLFYQQNINATTRLAIWKIEETENYFSSTIPIQASITHPHKRVQHYAGRYLLRYLFADFPYNEILIAQTKKPFLQSEKYHFSISHCADYAAAIVSSTNRVGIDIEETTERIKKIAPKFLSPTEKQIFSASNVQQQSLLWSAKEAIFKWWGSGNVQFNNAIQLQQFVLQNKGVFNASFNGLQLQVQYQLFNKLCLSFVVS